MEPSDQIEEAMVLASQKGKVKILVQLRKGGDN
jgi:hypothetical protein